VVLSRALPSGPRQFPKYIQSVRIERTPCPRCRLMGCQLLGEMTIVSQPLTVYQVCPRVASFGRSLDFQIPVTLLSSFVCRPEYREPSSGSQDILRICAIYLLQYFVRQSETIQAPVVAKHVGFVEVLV
jgi:hypothetical protein